MPDASPAPPARARRRWPRVLLTSLALTYALVCGALFFAQDALIFLPTRDADTIASLRAGAGARSIDVARDDAQLVGVYLPARPSRPAPAAAEPAPVVLYFGGNAEAVGATAGRLSWLRDRGADLVVVPYRGYDGSSGSPSADRLRGDALAIYDHLVAQEGANAARLYVFGYSLGSGVATYLAHERPLAGVILGAPFERLSDIAQASYPWLPVRPLLRHEFDSRALAPDITAPALILHGDADTLIPATHGRALAQAWGGPAELALIAGVGHNGLTTHADARPAIERFVFAPPRS